MKKLLTYLTLLGLVMASHGHAGLKDKLDDLLGSDDDTEQAEADSSAGSAALEQLTSSEVATGLKQALADGVRVAINNLGQSGGFWENPAVRIPVPENLESLAKAADRLGQDELVEQFAESLNRAAEQAVPATADLFAGAIENMTIEDAKELVRGGDDAATRFFERTTGDALRERILPLVAEATDSVGVTQYYKSLQDQAGGLMGLMGKSEETDLDGYVTNRATDALFAMIAEQERQIRADPVARSTDLLKAIFGG